MELNVCVCRSEKENLYINCVCMTWIRHFTLLKMFQKYPMQWRSSLNWGIESGIWWSTVYVQQSVKKRIWRSVLNCYVLKFEFVKEKQREQERMKEFVGMEMGDPISCAFLMMVRFHFFGGFSFFLGKILQHFVKATKPPHIAHSIYIKLAFFFYNIFLSPRHLFLDAIEPYFCSSQSVSLIHFSLHFLHIL